MRSLRPSDPWSIAAILCLFGGAVLLVIAWYDISGTADLYKQMPYLVSAGFSGLALIIVGSALVVAGRNDRVERRLAQLLEAITDAAVTNGPAAAENPADPEAAHSGDPLIGASEGYVGYVTAPQGTTYHRPGCLLTREKDAEPADPEAIANGSLTACPVCSPERPSDNA
ncbi:MAG TPA: hypothetical protein VHX15_09910 [Frankiaceae bacterium]|nr:hypothetical protein [Frankiaceae bacterium]